MSDVMKPESIWMDRLPYCQMNCVHFGCHEDMDPGDPSGLRCICLVTDHPTAPRQFCMSALNRVAEKWAATEGLRKAALTLQTCHKALEDRLDDGPDHEGDKDIEGIRDRLTMAQDCLNDAAMEVPEEVLR